MTLASLEHCSRTQNLPIAGPICNSIGMSYIGLGILGFLVILLFDIVALKRLPLAKPATWALGSALLIYATVMVCLSGDRLPLPGWSTWLGWLLLLVSLFLFLYSLFINLPLGKTYIASGIGDKLITSRLYALVRHPGVFWFMVLMLSLILVSRSSLLLIAAPVWILLDVLLVAIQDRFFLGRMFPGYDDYRRQTPMLWPNRKSLNAFINQLRGVGAK